MLEHNTFRSFMLIGGVIVLAIILAFFFTTPIVEIDDTARQQYEMVMDADLDGVTHLSPYQVIVFSIEGRSRGGISHY